MLKLTTIFIFILIINRTRKRNLEIVIVGTGTIVNPVITFMAIGRLKSQQMLVGYG